MQSPPRQDRTSDIEMRLVDELLVSNAVANLLKIRINGTVPEIRETLRILSSRFNLWRSS